MFDISKLVMPMYSFNTEFTRMPFQKGEGIVLTDIDGKQYLDCISGIWNVPFGFSNQNIIESITRQLERLPFSNLYVSAADVTVQYANKLIEKTNYDFEKLVYTCSGSESTELAIKFCRKYQKLIGTDRTVIGSFNYSYHGTTFGAMSISGVDKELVGDYKPLIGGVDWIHIEDIKEDWEKVIIHFIESNHDVLAGIIVEPIMGSGGVIEIEDKALQVLRKYCDKYNILLVFDEVATGFGRTGKMFAYQHSKVKPDLMCLSKAINNGYLPMGGVLLGKRVTEVFSIKGSFIEHFSTQNGNPVACAAALTVLDFMKDELFDEIEAKGAYLEKVLLDSICSSKIYVSIRRKGMMLALDVRECNSGRYLHEGMLEHVLKVCYKKGVIIHPFFNINQNSGIMLYPAFISTYEQLELMARKIGKVINQIFR